MRSLGVRLVFLAVVVLGVGSAATAAAATPVDCFAAIAREARTLITKRLRLLEQCREAELRAPGSCPDPTVLLAAIDARLARIVTTKCGAIPLAPLGWPGACDDGDTSDGFTVADLVTCLQTSHAVASAAVMTLLYDGDVVAPVRYADMNCQRAVGKRGAGFVRAVLGVIQKCRLDLLRDPFAMGQPDRCAVDDPPTVKAIAKEERKLARLVDGRCTDAQAAKLFLCEPDQAGVDGAVGCLIARLERIIDDRDASAPPDLIDYEFAGEPSAVCGNDRADAPGEECDGSDDAACPGACGAATGLFPCLCQTIPRQRVIEHANADFDLWSSGTAHDQHVPDGSGYVADLFDCDGPAGPDALCAVGPTCSSPPHSPCSPGPAEIVTGDSMCAVLGQGICRKTVGGANGPHCLLDVQRRCDTNAHCPGAGDRCVKTLHGPPLPVSAGGVSACFVRVFSEDVVGTTNLATGEGGVRLRQRLVTYLGGAVDEPCPVCGGFCAGSATSAGPGQRTPCVIDADCPNPPFTCVIDAVCSYGPNIDGACRANPPFGGTTVGFGTTSVDCFPPASASLVALDVLENPRTTATVELPAAVSCTASDFSSDACVGGTSDGRLCLGDGDCPGGECRPQCFCSGHAQPNGCDPACVGGANDAAPCLDDGDCPGGFCHAGDCRIDPSDTDSCQEGRCTVGPIVGRCSTSTYVPCGSDASCTAPACPHCVSGETCVFDRRQCFVNGAIERCGTPGIPERTTAAVGCASGANQAAIDALYGAPGPAALTQPETTIVVGF